VHDIGFDHALRRLDAAAVAREEHFVVALHQPFERGEEVYHVAFWRRDHGGVPPHDMITGEYDALADQGKTEVIWGMTGHVQHIEGKAFALDGITIP